MEGLYSSVQLGRRQPKNDKKWAVATICYTEWASHSTHMHRQYEIGKLDKWPIRSSQTIMCKIRGYREHANEEIQAHL